MNTIATHINRFNDLLACPAERLQDIGLAGARLYVSGIFFPAGSSKIENWGVTMFLFESEYQVPLLSPTLAAWLGTAGELLLPVLLTLGLFGRFSAVGLFVVNLVAVLSLSTIEPAALGQHLLWGLALSIVILWGPGKLSADYLLQRQAAARQS